MSAKFEIYVSNGTDIIYQAIYGDLDRPRLWNIGREI